MFMEIVSIILGVVLLGALFLGIALAVVFLLYVRVNDQIRRQEESREGCEALTGEEIYAHFLSVMEAYTLP